MLNRLRLRDRRSAQMEEMEEMAVRPAPDPDDDRDWTWLDALAEAERLLVAEMTATSREQVRAGLAVGLQLDLAATRHAANRLAILEVQLNRLRSEAVEQLAEEIDVLWPGNMVGPAMKADEPVRIVRW